MEIRLISARSLLAYRGTVIARTEAMEAFSDAQWASIRQLVDSGKVRNDQVTKVWSATMDGERTRQSHQMLNAQPARMNEPFVSPLTGARMLYPRDRSLGAPAEEIIQCRCWMIPRVDWLAGAG